MTHSPEQTEEARVTARLRELVKDISAFIDSASTEQKRSLLSLLEDSVPIYFGFLEYLRHGDRRKYARKTSSIEVECEAWGDVFKGLVRDISAGGMFVRTNRELSVGDQKTVCFLSPSGNQEPMHITAEVVWTGPGGVGVRFTSATTELVKMIESL